MSAYRWRLDPGLTLTFWPLFAVAIFQERGRWNFRVWRTPRNTVVPFGHGWPRNRTSTGQEER